MKKLIILFLFILCINSVNSIPITDYDFFPFNEGTGTIAYNYGDGTNDITMVNGANFTTGEYKLAANLDGNDDYLTLSNNQDIYGISLLFYNDNTITKTTAYEVLFSYNANSNNYISLGSIAGLIADETITINNGVGTGACHTFIRDNVSIGWHNLIINWDGSDYKIILDGINRTVYYGSCHALLIDDWTDINIGVMSDRINGYFNGKLDNIYLSYNRSFTLPEIEAISNESMLFYVADYSNNFYTNYSIEINNLNESTNISDYVTEEYFIYNMTGRYGDILNISVYNSTFLNFSRLINTYNIDPFFHILYLYKPSSLYINLYKESNQARINTNITLRYMINGSSNYITNDTGYIFIENITAGLYELRFNSTLYSTRYYYLTILNDSYILLNAYLLEAVNSNAINLFLYCSGSSVSDTTITAYININGSYAAVAQRITDSTGLATINLNPVTTYRFIVNSEYGIYTKDITPSISPINFYLCGGSSQPYNWTTIYDKFSYLLTPEDILIEAALINFSLTASSPEGFLNSFGIYYNSSMQDNISGSPAGGTVLITLNLTNSTGTIPITYWFNVSGEDYYSFVKNYKIKSFTTAGNNSATVVLDTYSSDIPAFWRYIFVTLASIMVMAALSNVIPAIANTIIGFIVYVPFAIYGWINPLFLIPMGALLFVYYMVERY